MSYVWRGFRNFFLLLTSNGFLSRAFQTIVNPYAFDMITMYDTFVCCRTLLIMSSVHDVSPRFFGTRSNRLSHLFRPKHATYTPYERHTMCLIIQVFCTLGLLHIRSLHIRSFGLINSFTSKVLGESIKIESA